MPDHVLNEPGELTVEEWAWIEQHPVVGGDLGNRARSLRRSPPSIRFHHAVGRQRVPRRPGGHPACVEALVDVLADSGVLPERTRTDLDELVRAAADCHPVRERWRRVASPRVGLVEG